MLISHSLIYLLGRGCSGIINFLAIVIYTRLISPEEYGQYAMIIAISGLVNTAVFQWMSVGLVRYLPGLKEERHQIFLSSIFSAFFALIVVSGIFGGLFLWLWPLAEGSKNLWIIGLGLLWLAAGFELNLNLLRSKIAPVRYSLVSLCKAVVAFVTGVSLVLYGWGAKGLLLGIMAGTGLPMIFMVYKEWKGIQLRLFDRTIMKNLFIYGLPVTVTLSLGILINSSNRLFLNWLSGAKETGLYAAASDFTELTILLLMTVLNLAAYPLVVREMADSGVIRARKQLEQYGVLLFFIGLPTLAFLILLTPNFVQVVYGDVYRDTIHTVMPLIALSAFLQGIKSFYFDMSFQLSQRSSLQLWSVLAAVSVNVVLNILWIPKWGVMGAAYATLATYAVSVLVSWLIGRRIFPLPIPGKPLLQVSIATLFMVCILWLTLSLRGPLFLILQVVLGALAYGFAVIVMNIGGVQGKVVQWAGRLRSK